MAKILKDLDRKLMDELQINADRTTGQIAKKLSVSTSTIHRRIVDLNDANCIIGIVAVANPKLAGRDEVFVVSLKLSTTRGDDLKSLERWAIAAPAIQQAFLMADEPNMTLIVRVGTIGELNALLQKIQAENTVVTEAVARTALKTVKQTLFVPFGANNS